MARPGTPRDTRDGICGPVPHQCRRRATRTVTPPLPEKSASARSPDTGRPLARHHRQADHRRLRDAKRQPTGGRLRLSTKKGAALVLADIGIASPAESPSPEGRTAPISRWSALSKSATVGIARPDAGFLEFAQLLLGDAGVLVL